MILFRDETKEVEEAIAEVVKEVKAEEAEEKIAEAESVATDEEDDEISLEREEVSLEQDETLEEESEEIDELEESKEPGNEESAEAEKDELETEVDSLIEELDEIEKQLGMKQEFEDIELPVLKPIILPPIKAPEPAPVITRADFAKLDDEQFNLLMKKLNNVENMEAEIKAMKEVIDERLSLDFRAMYDNIMEKTNIEAIKVYRNVQAVVIEENAKQNQALFGLDSKSDSLRRRMNNVLIFATVSFVVSVLVMLITILPAFGIKLF